MGFVVSEKTRKDQDVYIDDRSRNRSGTAYWYATNV